MTHDASAEETIRAFYHAFNDAQPERFAALISDSYVDNGHQPPGRGPLGARADYESALRKFGHIDYVINGVVASGENVAAAWTGLSVHGEEFSGLSLYRVVGGQIVETSNTTIGQLPRPRGTKREADARRGPHDPV